MSAPQTWRIVLLKRGKKQVVRAPGEPTRGTLALEGNRTLIGLTQGKSSVWDPIYDRCWTKDTVEEQIKYIGEVAGRVKALSKEANK